MRRVNAMVIDFKPGEQPSTRAEFTYHMTPATITITGKGSISVGKDLDAVLRKIEYWNQAPVIKFRIMVRQGHGVWHGVRWDGKTAASFPLNETDEAKAMRALLLQYPLEGILRQGRTQELPETDCGHRATKRPDDRQRPVYARPTVHSELVVNVDVRQRRVSSASFAPSSPAGLQPDR
jgi:hypothetical protein